MKKVFDKRFGGTEIVAPSVGQTGWLQTSAPMRTKVIFDKAGTGRRTREQGGDFFEMEPDWVDPVEHQARKEARSRAWKKLLGPAEYVKRRSRNERLLLRGGRDGFYGLQIHPHEAV